MINLTHEILLIVSIIYHLDDIKYEQLRKNSSGKKFTFL